MFNFKVDYSNNETSGFEPLPEGNYECVIQNVQERVTRNNKESLSFRLVVRNDLDNALPETNGKYKNRILFDDHWKRDINGQYIYHMESLMYVLEAAGIPEGTEINGVDQLIDMLTGQPVKVFTKVEHNDYQGEKENTIAPWGYSKSDYPNSQHTWKDGNQPMPKATPEDNPFTGVQDQQTDISDDSLPF